jgi:hypothetical protein
VSVVVELAVMLVVMWVEMEQTLLASHKHLSVVVVALDQVQQVDWVVLVVVHQAILQLFLAVALELLGRGLRVETLVVDL